MSKRMLRKISNFITNAERREFAGELAEKKYEGWNDASASMLKLGYAKGIEDAMLTPEDIKTIHEIAEDVWEPNCDEQECYQEVLKRFNEIKFKK